jgi:hypothetical protein
MGSEKEVARIDAERHVTLVENVQIVWDQAVVQQPCDARGILIFAFEPKAGLVMSSYPAQPEPAPTVRLWNVFRFEAG